MKIAVLGATGGIGKYVLRYALARDYKVHAYVRTPSKLPAQEAQDTRLHVFEGQVWEYNKLKEALRGCDAVVMALGISMKPGSKDSASVEAHKNVIMAMEELKIRRLVDWATPTLSSKEDVRSYITVLPGIMAGAFLPKAKKAILEVGGLITASDLDWTVVRFMAPKERPGTGRVKISFGKEKLRFSISKEDIAQFMVEQIESPEFVRRMPIIGS